MLKTLPHYLVAFAIVLLVPIVVVSGLVANHFSNAERGRLEALMDSVDQDIAALVESEISITVAVLRSLASARSLRDGDLARFEAHAREVSRTTGTDIALVDPTGQQLVQAGLSPGPPPVAETDPNLLNAVRATRRVYVSNLHAAIAPGEARIQVAVPVTDGETMIAILTSTIRIARLVQLLREGLPEGPFFATILDRTGTIVARSKAPEAFIGKPFPQLASASQGANGSTSLVNPAGIEIFLHYRRLELSGWVVAAAVERAALTAPLTRRLQGLALLATGLAVLAGTGAWWFGRKLTRAHDSLLAAARLLGEGRAIAPPTTSLREVNLVGQALATASRAIVQQADELQWANQALEERVAARTRELVTKTALLETTLETMQQGLVVIDGAGRMAVCNPPARRMLEIPDPVALGCPVLGDLGGLQAGDAAALAIARLLQPGLTGDRIVILPGPAADTTDDATVIEVQSVSLPAGGGFVRTFTDITERRRHERELEAARDVAEQASRAKGDFVTTMSHEMRTPLNAMIGCAELLLDDPDLGARARRNAERIQSAGAAMLCLVDDILDIGKMEAGIIDVRTEPFSLRKVAEDAVEFVRPWAADKNLGLTLSVDCGPGDRYLGDPHRLRQILLNLLNNAVKFTAAGQVDLTIGAGGGMAGSSRCRFAIRDTGIGILKADQGKLFRRFQQIDPRVERRFAGVGLGLAITKQLVERMGGTIGVESDLGAGATFWFELPLEPAVADQHGALPTVRPERRCARILVAEDVVVNQELARELLETAGHVVDVVADGVAAVAAVKSGTYDLVLMDVSMPELDGLSATRLIRECGLPAGATPVVACTANVLPTQVMAFRDAGIDAYLRKPLWRTELYATIDRVLAQDLPRAGLEALPCPYRPGPDDVQSFVALLGPQRVLAALDGLTGELQVLTHGDWSDDGRRQELRGRAHASFPPPSCSD